MKTIQCPECGKEFETKVKSGIGCKIATLVLSILFILSFLVALIYVWYSKELINEYNDVATAYNEQVSTLDSVQSELDAEKKKNERILTMAEANREERNKESLNTSTESTDEQNINIEETSDSKQTSTSECQLTPGYYVVGEDIDQGKYNIVILSGRGLLHIYDSYDSAIKNGKIITSYVLGISDDDFYSQEIKNAYIGNGECLKVDDGMKINFIPVE